MRRFEGFEPGLVSAMESLGICLGAATIGIVHLQGGAGRPVVIRAENHSHEGRPQQFLSRLESLVPGLDDVNLCVTGRELRNTLDLSNISEAEAVELACRHTLPGGHPYRLVISAGGETLMIYQLNAAGLIQDAWAGNKCASGTGEFFLQQLCRMSIDLEEVAGMKLPEKIFKVSGRCSVFCKSDCTHALNSGIPKAEVVAGFSRMMATKILELWHKFPPQPTLLIGGCSRNRLLCHFLKSSIDNLFIPPSATCFEALGAALWAQNHTSRPWPAAGNLSRKYRRPANFLKPLSAYAEMVEFRHQPLAVPGAGDRTILGLDVGSTTTKGVVMRCRDRAVLASEYRRTSGDPVGAARKIYAALARQFKVPVKIIGLGITGSGRKIAGLHALSFGIINEIVAHAAGAAGFDSEVETIFELGGQDAKYINLVNGVPCDYAMNEACSAGTGSFLEEAARESFALEPEAISHLALQGVQPPDFSDQCAAFIGSDIKRAIQEGVLPADIMAGLVYSICRNYLNRVKGNRPIGNKIFMQGGTCYNRAVPVAMAALTGKKIVVPPDPGLVGAFGVALEVERRIKCGLLAEAKFDLLELAGRKLGRGKSFICKGSSSCDRGCKIARFIINGRTYPFGGSCSRYENQNFHRPIKTGELDLVAWRERRVFQDQCLEDTQDNRPTVGMNRSFLIHTYFPFFNCFFSELGFRLIVPDQADEHGIDRQGAAFCFPAELAHAYAASLLKLKPDFIFLPLVRQAGIQSEKGAACSCVFVQGEPFYLRTAFPGLKSANVITPTLDFARPLLGNLPAFVETAITLGVQPEKAAPALRAAIREQEQFFVDLLQTGEASLAQSAGDENPAIILFGRPYNSFTGDANQSIPARFASRGYRVIPCDMLPYAEEKLAVDMNIYWGMGRMILKGAEFVKKQPHLFPVYITNFSCGPDSFIIGHFRDCLGRKPALVLELDNHTAAAGLETRIEAFLDIIQGFRLIKPKLVAKGSGKRIKNFSAAIFARRDNTPGIQTSNYGWLPLTHPRIRVFIPSMSRYGSRLLAGAFQRINIRAVALPPADAAILHLGRSSSSCKECLPLHTTLGSILDYLQNRRPPGEVSVYLMASSEGPCRFGQYRVLSEKVLRERQFFDVALLSPSSMNGYAGLGRRFLLAAWRALLIGDIFDEMWATIMAVAVDREAGLGRLNREFEMILSVIHQNQTIIFDQLTKSAASLQKITLRKPYVEIPQISLVGEIYARHDPLSLQGLNEYLADQGFIVRTAGNVEWIDYVDWLIENKIEGQKNLNFRSQLWLKQKTRQVIINRLAPSGLFYHDSDAIESLLEAGRKFISPDLTCETILTVGSALYNILSPACGVISVSPFGCLPSRMAEAILNEVFTITEVRRLKKNNDCVAGVTNQLPGDYRLPFLALETDGNPFPQIINARLEIFLLQARRLQAVMVAS